MKDSVKQRAWSDFKQVECTVDVEIHPACVIISPSDDAVNEGKNCLVDPFSCLNKELSSVLFRHKEGPKFDTKKVPPAEKFTNHTSLLARNGSDKGKKDEAQETSKEPSLHENENKRAYKHHSN